MTPSASSGRPRGLGGNVPAAAHASGVSTAPGPSR